MVAIHAIELPHESSLDHAVGPAAVPAAPCNVSMHGMHHMVPPPAPVFTAGHADEQHLFQSAKAIVQHHFGPVMGVHQFDLACSPALTHTSLVHLLAHCADQIG